MHVATVYLRFEPFGTHLIEGLLTPPPPAPPPGGGYIKDLHTVTTLVYKLRLPVSHHHSLSRSQSKLVVGRAAAGRVRADRE